MQPSFCSPEIGANAAIRDGRQKLVRPMIRGTRFFRDESCLSDDDRARTAAFIEADIRHKENRSLIGSDSLAASPNWALRPCRGFLGADGLGARPPGPCRPHAGVY